VTQVDSLAAREAALAQREAEIEARDRRSLELHEEALRVWAQFKQDYLELMRLGSQVRAAAVGLKSRWQEVEEAAAVLAVVEAGQVIRKAARDG